MITKEKIRKFYKEAKLHFDGEDFPKLKFETDKYEEFCYKKQGWGYTAAYRQCRNDIVIYDYNLKRKKLTDIYWQAITAHELTHWYFRNKNEDHTKSFAKKLLSIYKKMFNKKQMIEILRKEQWLVAVKVGSIYKFRPFRAYKMCDKYNLLKMLK